MKLKTELDLENPVGTKILLSDEALGSEGEEEKRGKIEITGSPK